MAVVELRAIVKVLNALTPSLSNSTATSDMAPVASSLAVKATALANQVDQAIKSAAIVKHSATGNKRVYAYEVDGFGNHLFMDDANVPSLLSLPYLGYVSAGMAAVNHKCVWNRFIRL